MKDYSNNNTKLEPNSSKSYDHNHTVANPTNKHLQIELLFDSDVMIKEFRPLDYKINLDDQQLRGFKAPLSH